ncbi:MAG: energy transducer TonB [Tannerella sp.]|jgi:TonB family protein|nr:energy transducer TonB [Tannerella sp.]
MKFDKDDILALIGTIVVHLLLLLLLYLSVIRTIVPNEDSGILVNFGDFLASEGVSEPQYSARTKQEEIPPQPAPRPLQTAKEDLITQDEEETVAIPDKKVNKKENKDDEAKAKKEREDAERKRKEAAQKQQQEAISNRVSNAFSVGKSQDSRQGEAATAADNQGSPFGNTEDNESDAKTGGFGRFDLDGRYIGQGGLPRPKWTGQESGKIVLDITVDPAGNVIYADIGRGTNIDDLSTRQYAIEAAKRAKFNKIKGSDNQKGTITYIYNIY